MAATMSTDTVRTETFPGEPASLRAARHFVGRALRGWGCQAAQVVQPAVLLADELATNAVVHAGAAFDLTVRLRGDTVRIEVRDDNPSEPRVVPWEQVAAGGRGLHLVDVMAASWGTRRIPGGKIVWCDLPRRAG